MQQIEATHLSRLAVVYIRQSTEKQVRENQGSLEYQRGQVDVARRYGWRQEQIVVSADLGLSGLDADRTEYQNVKALICAGKVGAFFITDVSRGGRDEREWFDLLELLTVHNVLLIKNGSIVDPRDESQALMTKIEALMAGHENRLRRATMHRGRLGKARSGKAVTVPPAGYLPEYEVRDGVPRKTGRWVKDEPEVQRAIQAAFAAFAEGGSLRRAVDILIAQGVKIPSRRSRPERAGGL